MLFISLAFNLAPLSLVVGFCQHIRMLFAGGCGQCENAGNDAANKKDAATWANFIT